MKPTPSAQKGAPNHITVLPGVDDLADALERVADHGAVLLEAGRHVLKRPIKLARTLTLCGAGRDETIIEVRAAPYGVWLAASAAHLLIEELTFEMGLETSGDLVVCGPGRLEASWVRFRRARGDVDQGRGLVVEGMSRADLSQCLFEDNARAGVALSDTAQVTLDGCAMRHNDYGVTLSQQARAVIKHCAFQEQGRDGVLASQNALLQMEDCEVRESAGCGVRSIEHTSITVSRSKVESCGLSGISLETSRQGTVTDSFLAHNAEDGVAVSGSGRVKLELNTCTRNQRNGLGFFGGSQGSAKENVCSQNGWSGVLVSGQSRVQIHFNTCRFNTRHGLMITEEAHTSALRNNCSHNGEHGIVIQGKSDVALDRNECRSNGAHGIFWGRNTEGSAENNLCEANLSDGLVITERSKPRLTRNQSRRNRGSGVSIEGVAQPHLEDNAFERNGKHGVVVTDMAAPTLQANRCGHNDMVGLFFRQKASGRAQDNVCLLNGQQDLVVEASASPHLLRNEAFREDVGASPGPAATQRVGALVPAQRPRQANVGLVRLASVYGFGPLMAGAMALVPLVLAALVAPVWVASLWPLALVPVLVALTAWWMAWMEIDRARVLLSHGQVVFGKVLGVSPATREVEFSYLDAAGQSHRGAVFLTDDKSLDEYRRGVVLTLLADPDAPHRVVLPAVLGATFEESSPLADERRILPAASAALEGLVLHRDSAGEQVPLLSSLEPMPYRGLGRRSTKRARQGVLLLSEHTLRARLTQSHKPVEVPWERPFVVVLSVWLLGDGEAELNVSVRSVGEGPDAPWVRFRTRWPQRAISAELDLKQELFPWVAPGDFERLWAHLSHYGAFHGLDLSRKVIAPAPPAS